MRDRAYPPRRFGGVKRLLGGVFVLLLAGCQSAGREEASERASDEQASAVASGGFERCYDLDGAASELRLLVYRAGPLARVGHNHVMVSRGLLGRLALADPVPASKVLVRLPVASLEIDPPALRREEGDDFATEISDEAREGTRGNLLGPRVLDAEQHPYIDVSLTELVGPLWAADATLAFAVRGLTRSKSVGLSALETEEGLRVLSSFTLTHEELGMTPFSVLGGGLRVAEELRVRVDLRFVALPERGETCLVLPQAPESESA